MSLYISHNTKTAKVRPKTKDELRSLIEQELKCQGPHADLNFIDTSLITDMSSLFMRLYIRNIKIGKWDTSNVTDMCSMFSGCKKFDADISSWDVSKVENMAYMFCNCSKVSSDLSGWDISNVVYNNYMFDGCYNCTIDHRPQVSYHTRLIHSMYEISKRYNVNASKYSSNTIITSSATYDLLEELKNYIG